MEDIPVSAIFINFLDQTQLMENVILEHLQKIEKQLEMLNSKIENFLGFEELSDEELRELDEIEAEMERGENSHWNNVRDFSEPAGKKAFGLS